MSVASAFRLSERFTIIHGDRIERRDAERVLSSILYNHDTVPDLVTLTCELAIALRRGLTFAEAAAIAAAEGAAFDGEGWLRDQGVADRDDHV
jgi:hypothetical protein